MGRDIWGDTHTHTQRERERELSENERGSLASDKVVKCCISKDICHTNTESTDRQIYLERSRRVPAWMCVCVCVCVIPSDLLLRLATGRGERHVCSCLCRLLGAVT